MVITFDDEKQLEYITNIVNRVSDVYEHSSVSTISNLAGRLAGLLAASKDKPDIQLTIDLSEDHCDNDDHNEVLCLYNIIKMVNDSSADEVDAACDMYSKLRKYYIKSDVPRFLEMLRDYHVPAEYCTDLFKNWCSSEGTAVLAEDCLGIQAKYNIIMTPVWNWVCNNDASPETDWTDEVNKYKEAING